MFTADESGPKMFGMTRRNFVALSATAMVSLVGANALSGCSSSEGGSSDTPESPESLLRVGVVSLDPSDAMDPASATTTGGYIMACQVFDSLMDYDEDGLVAPRLAESVEMQDEDLSVWIVKLRDDAKWHDGSQVTADDVVYTVKRWFDETLPPSESLAYIDPDKVTAVDDTTVKFELTQEVIGFPAALASPIASIVPQDFDRSQPMGSGPFTFSSSDPGVQLIFDRFDDYWGEVAHATSLEVVSYDDTSSEINALVAGQIDVAADCDPTLIDIVTGSSDCEIYNYPTSGALSWAMNCEQKPFDDPAVRQALRLAVNRDELVSNVYAGYGDLGNDYWSPFDPDYTTDLPQREYDPEGAKALLTEAGYTLPVAVDLWGCPNQPTSDRQNELLVEQAKEAGFEINFHKVDSATFYGDAYGTYPLSLSYWGYLSIFDQASMTITSDAPYNSTHWINDEYDALYNQAIATVDDAERKELVEQMQTIEYENGSYVVPLFMEKLVAHSNKVSGFRAYPNTDGAVGYHFNILSVSE